MDIHILFIIFTLLELQISWVVMGNVRFEVNIQYEVEGQRGLWGFGDNGQWEVEGQRGLLGWRDVGYRSLRGDGDYEGWGHWAIVRLRGDGEWESWRQWVMGGWGRCGFFGNVRVGCNGQWEDKKIPNPYPN